MACPEIGRLSAISVRTFFSPFIRNWVAPIQDLMVPKGWP